jgi:hypothetical protein
LAIQSAFSAPEAARTKNVLGAAIHAGITFRRASPFPSGFCIVLQ